MGNWMPDGASTRARIGVITPHLDAVPESEFQTLAPVGVSIHAARVPLGMVGPDGEIIPHVDANIAKAFAEPPAVDNAVSLLSAVSPGAIVFAFTSSSYILGNSKNAWSNVHEIFRSLSNQTHWSWHFEHCTPIALH
jgi:maleate isomerase